MTIRLLISDIDGTFVRSDKSVGDPVVAACDRLRAAGVQLALISARPASGMVWIADKLGLDGPIGAFNGGTIVRRNGTPDGTVISAERLDPAVAEAALAAIERPGVIRWLFHKGRWHTTALDDYYTAKERHTTSQEPVVVASFAGLTDAVDKIVAVSGAEAMLGDLEREVAGKLGAGANVIRSQTYYLDITAPKANKGDGVAALAAAYGVDLAAGIEALTLDQAALDAREAWRQDFLDRLFYLARKDAAEAARAETAAGYRQTIADIAAG